MWTRYKRYSLEEVSSEIHKKNTEKSGALQR